MSPAGDHALPGGPGREQPARPAGLLGKLLAAVRPEFRQDVLAFGPADPVLGGTPCKVAGCGTPRKEEVIRRVLAHHAEQTRQAAARSRPAPAQGYRPETLDVLFRNGAS